MTKWAGPTKTHKKKETKRLPSLFPSLNQKPTTPISCSTVIFPARADHMAGALLPLCCPPSAMAGRHRQSAPPHLFPKLPCLLDGPLFSSITRAPYPDQRMANGHGHRRRLEPLAGLPLSLLCRSSSPPPIQIDPTSIKRRPIDFDGTPI